MTMWRILDGIVSLILAVMALGGGVNFIRTPDGSSMQISPKPMQETYGIETFLIPGIVMLIQFVALPIIGVILVFFTKYIKVGFICQAIAGIICFPWIFIQVGAYGWSLPSMQILVLLIGALLISFSYFGMLKLKKQKIE